MELLEIKSDVLDVVARIKNWNSKYRVYYNTKSKKLMLYLIENELTPPIYCLTFPNSQIDERMIDVMQKSEIQNRKALIQEIEESNALLLQRERKRCLNKMEEEYESKRHN